MTQYVLGIIYFVCFAGAVTCILFALYYFITMLGSAKPEKKHLLPFLGPFLLVFPQLWNTVGNRARVRFVVCIVLFGLFFGAMAVLLNIPFERQ